MKSRQSALALRWLEFQKLKELRNDFKELRNELKELPYDFALALRGIEEEQWNHCPNPKFGLILQSLQPGLSAHLTTQALPHSPVSNEIPDLCEISDQLSFVSCVASQSKEIKFVNYFFDVCCIN